MFGSILALKIKKIEKILEYASENPTTPINKELYMKHDADVMNMVIEFFDN